MFYFCLPALVVWIVIAILAIVAVFSGTGVWGQILRGLLWSLGVVLALLLWPFAMALWPVFLVLGLVTWWRVRRARGEAVLNYVEQAVRLNLPLADALAAAELGEEGKLRMRLAALRRYLEGGARLAPALALSVPEISARHLRLIAAAEDIGRLPPFLARLGAERRIDQRSGAIYWQSTGWWWYPVAVAGVMVLMLTAVMVFVIPKFEKIFEDFGSSLPDATRALMFAARWLIGHGYPGQMVPGLVQPMLWAVPLVLAGLLLWLTRGGRLVRDQVLWRLPVLGSATRRRGLADVCHVLSQSAAAGLPLERGLEEAQQLRINAVLSARLRRWSEAMNTGVPLREAARQAQMPPLLVGLLPTGQGAVDLADVLRFLDQYYRYHISRLLLLAQQAVLPLTVIVLALMVGFVVLALFLPLVTLINSVSSSVWSY